MRLMGILIVNCIHKVLTPPQIFELCILSTYQSSYVQFLLFQLSSHDVVSLCTCTHIHAHTHTRTHMHTHAHTRSQSLLFVFIRNFNKFTSIFCGIRYDIICLLCLEFTFLFSLSMLMFQVRVKFLLFLSGDVK